MAEIFKHIDCAHGDERVVIDDKDRHFGGRFSVKRHLRRLDLRLHRGQRRCWQP